MAVLLVVVCGGALGYRLWLGPGCGFWCWGFFMVRALGFGLELGLVWSVITPIDVYLHHTTFSG